MSLKALFCTVLMACPLSLYADTLWMKNGDRLTGTIKLVEDGKLLLKTEYAGEVILKREAIATFETDQALLVKNKQGESQRFKGAAAAEQGQVKLLSEQSQVVSISSITQMMPPKPVVEDWVWSNNLDLSLDYKSAENDIEDHQIDFSSQARHGYWRHNFQAEYNREKKNHKLNTHNYELDYELDRFLDEHWFWEGQLKYRHDWVENLREVRSLGTGPGYQFWDDELGAFSLVGLLTRDEYISAEGYDEDLYSLGLGWDYQRYLLVKEFEIFTHGDLSRPLDSAVNYELDAEAGLRYKLTSLLSLNLKGKWYRLSGYEDVTNERHYSLGLGVSW